jgi:hypothetical protein
MAISFIGVSSSWTSTAASTSFTINKPAGTLQDGDLMIAVLSWTTGSTLADLTATAPSGWTKQDEVYNGGDGWDHQLAVFTRTYASGDPATWSGTLSASSAKVKVSGTCAYRGVQSILAKGTSSQAGPGTASYSTATVNNTQANSWRFCTAGYESASLTYAININEVTSRFLDGATNTGDNDNVQLRISDSNGAIATGNTSRTVSRSAAWDASCSWIAILQESTGTPATGTMAMTTPSLTATSDGDVTDPATLAAQTPSVTFLGDGYGQPPVVTGTAAMQTPSLAASMAGATDVLGSMSATVLPLLALRGETRVFGERVILVGVDDRTIKVPSRALDD